APVFPARHDSELRRLIAFHRFGCECDLCAGTNVLMQERAKIHPVKLVAAENQIKLERSLEEVTHVLPHGVGGSLVPLRPFGRLLGRQDIDETPGKIVELVARLNVAMQRHGVELREQIDRAQPGVQAVTDRDIDQPIVEGSRCITLKFRDGIPRLTLGMTEHRNGGKYAIISRLKLCVELSDTSDARKRRPSFSTASAASNIAAMIPQASRS